MLCRKPLRWLCLGEVRSVANVRVDSKLPPAEVLRFFEDKGLKPAWSWADVWQQENRVAFTVAGLMEQDVLADMRDAVDECLRDGLPFTEFKKKITPILADKGWLARKSVVDPVTGAEKDVNLGEPQRLKTIFDTNLRTANAAGQWSRIERVKDALPYLKYGLGPSRVHRPEHQVFDGLILRVDDPFWRTHMPPNGFGCRCGVRQLTEREAQRYGGPSASPELPMRSWRNPRTGKELMVPYGCDPGFDHNPGMDRLGGLEK